MSGSGMHLGVPGGEMVAIAVALGFLAIWLLGLREALGVSVMRRRVLLIVLRTVTAVLGAAVVLQPSFVEEKVEQTQGRLSVLLDVSRSMSVRDEQGVTRLARARAIAEKLVEETQGRVELHVFGNETRSISRERLASLGKAGPSAAWDDASDLGPALRKVIGGPESDIGAVVVLSDGADTSGVRPSDFGSGGARVHTVQIGEASALHDDAIVALHADGRAFLREQAKVEVHLRSSAGKGQRVVSLRQHGEPVAEASVELDERGEGKVSLAFTPTELGRAVYNVSIPVSADDGVPENNERGFLARVTRDRLRVLLVCGAPTWDTRFLRAFLKSDPAIDLITFFILRTGSDLSMASPEELSLIPFPTDELFREHLDSFDVVLFQDFDHGPYQVGRYLARIRDYVRDGGGFAMIGGARSFGAGAYQGTPIAEILPVAIVSPSASDSALLESEIAPRLAEAGIAHPVVELSPQVEHNTAAWARLAPLIGANRLGDPREGAQALLEHPSERTPSGKPMPVLAVSDAGKGRVLALGADSSFRWGITTAGEIGDASAYERFWDRALRWLARDPRLDPVRIETDREQYGPSAPMVVRQSLRDAHYQPIADETLELLVLDASGNERSVTPFASDVRGVAETRLEGPAGPGGYRIVARDLETKAVLGDEGFVVEAGGEELADPRSRAEVLEALARESGGSFFAAGDVPDATELPRGRSRAIGTRVHAPFSAAWVVLLLVLLFAAEWMVRRAIGLR